MKNQLIARMHPQRRRFHSVVSDVAIARRPLSHSGRLIPEVQRDFQNAVLAAQLGRILRPSIPAPARGQICSVAEFEAKPRVAHNKNMSDAIAFRCRRENLLSITAEECDR